MPNTNLVIDIETSGTGVDTKILTIGAVCGDLKFYERVDPTCKANADRSWTKGTAWFWNNTGFRQKEHAHGGTKTLEVVLQELRDFIDSTLRLSKVKPWGNGSVFDISILAHAYAQVGIVVPWNYSNVRDLRTIVDLAGYDKKGADAIPFVGVEHNALDDAVHEEKVLNWCLDKLGVMRDG